MRRAMRLAAMMGLQVIFVFTHDSIGLGEDGPTHQPIEQVAGLAVSHLDSNPPGRCRMNGRGLTKWPWKEIRIRLLSF